MSKKINIKLDKNNFRIHSEKNKNLIKNSLKDFGAGRSILIDKDDVVIAGNGTFEQAQELGVPIKVVETDGKELIAVKRTDLDENDYRRKRLAVLDNSTTDSSSFDMEKLNENFSLEELSELGIGELGDLDIKDDWFKDVDEKGLIGGTSDLHLTVYFASEKLKLSFVDLLRNQSSTNVEADKIFFEE